MPKKPNLSDLKQFANTRISKCSVCNFEEKDWIETAKKAGHSPESIAKYLTEKCGYPTDQITEGRIRGHFRRNHHLNGKNQKT